MIRGIRPLNLSTEFFNTENPFFSTNVAYVTLITSPDFNDWRSDVAPLCKSSNTDPRLRIRLRCPVAERPLRLVALGDSRNGNFTRPGPPAVI